MTKPKWTLNQDESHDKNADVKALVQEVQISLQPNQSILTTSTQREQEDQEHILPLASLCMSHLERLSADYRVIHHRQLKYPLSNMTDGVLQICLDIIVMQAESRHFPILNNLKMHTRLLQILTTLKQ